MIVLNPPPKLNNKEKRSIVTYFLPFYQYKSIENNTKIILTHVLKIWNEKKSSAHPSTHALTPAELVSLNVYSIEPR